jgi:hypothetical protein
MYEAYVAQLLNRIEAQEAEVAKLGTMAEQTRADAVTRAAADEKRIEALRHESERWKAAYSDRCALLDVIHASLGIDKGDNVIGEIDRIHKARNGLQAQVQDLRAALAKEQELHAATALRLSTEAAKMVELTWKIGDWVKAPLGTRGEIVEIGNEYIRVNIPGEQHPMRWWPKHMCTLCDPPAETCADPDLTQLHAKGKEAWSDVPNATQWVEELRGNTEVTHDTPEGKDVAESVIRDSRKTEPKPGDTVRLVRIPSRDVVSPELQTTLAWPWIERWGTLNQTALVVEPAYQLDGALSVCLSTNVHVRWPISCIEVITEATHDTEAGKAAAQNAEKTEQVADEIKVGDVVEVFQSTASCTFKTDIGTRGTVLQLDDSCVDTAPLDGFLAPKGNHVALCDVRKVTT